MVLRIFVYVSGKKVYVYKLDIPCVHTNGVGLCVAACHTALQELLLCCDKSIVNLLGSISVGLFSC